VVYSWVLARSDRPRSMAFFADALQSDVADSQHGTTAEGVHLGAMAGTVDQLLRVSTGIVVKGDVLLFNPELPPEMEYLESSIRYRGHSLALRLTHDALTVCGEDLDVAPIALSIAGKIYDYASGTTRVFALDDKKT
jgi:trehalose/maltose hydrolase-like predicted phosphorylase